MTTGQRWRQLTLTLHAYTKQARRKGFYTRKRPAPRNWAAYDQAQLNEMPDVLDSIRIGVDTASRDLAECLNRLRPGRPRRLDGAADLAKAVLVQQYVGLSNRIVRGCLRSLSGTLGLVCVPGYKEVERAYSDPDVAVLLLGFFDLTVGAVRHVRDFSVDGTGLSTSIKDNWERHLAGQRRYGRYAVFEKLVCMVEQTYGVVAAFRVLDSMHGNESPCLKPLVEEVAGRIGGHDGLHGDGELGFVCGDSAYLSRDNCSAVVGLGGVPRFYPKKNSSLRSFGSRAYQEMFLALIDDPQSWLEEYHRRYVCESTFSSLKRRCLVPLRREVGCRRKQEVLVRICVYNLIRLSYARWTKNLRTPFRPAPR